VSFASAVCAVWHFFFIHMILIQTIC
jgi:hypothetical protein